MLILKYLILLLFINIVYGNPILIKNLKKIQSNMIGFEKDGCPLVFSRVLNESQCFKNYCYQYIIDNDINKDQENADSFSLHKEYRFVNEILKIKLESLSKETEYLLNRCRNEDFDKRALSLERPARLLQFLQEWNSTLRFFVEELESGHIGLPLHDTKKSEKIIYQSPSKLEMDFYHFRDCKDDYCPEMVVIPNGEFVMGGTDEEHKDLGVAPYTWSWDKPLHKVNIKKRFAIGQYEVTLKQFREYVKETGHKIPKGCTTVKTLINPDNGLPGTRVIFTDGLDYENLGEGFENQNDNYPVVCLRREDARHFASWLSDKTGQTYRLPTEAEWEYTARANTGNNYYIWGNSTKDACKYANVYDLTSFETYNFTFEHFECRDNFYTTSEVGTFLPNQFGIHDMLANAREWVDDCWHYGYNDAPSDGSRWGEENNGLCSFGVLRGGAWVYNTFNVRIAYRNAYFSSQAKSYMWGMRLVREIN